MFYLEDPKSITITDYEEEEQEESLEDINILQEHLSTKAKESGRAYRYSSFPCMSAEKLEKDSQDQERIEELKNKVKNLEEANSELLEQSKNITPKKRRTKSNLGFDKSIGRFKVDSMNLDVQNFENSNIFHKDNEVGVLKFEIDQRERELREMNRGLIDDNQHMERETGQLADEIMDVRRQNLDLEQESRILLYKLSNQREELDDIGKINTELLNDIEETELVIVGLRGAIDEKKIDLGNCESEYKSLTQKVKKLQLEDRRLQFELGVVNQKLVDVNKEMVEKEDIIKQRLEEIEVEQLRYENIKEESEISIQKLRENLDGEVKRLSSIEIEVEEDKFRVAQLEKRVGLFEGRMKAKEDEREKLDKQYQELMQKHQELVGRELEEDVETKRIRNSISFYQNKILDIQNQSKNKNSSSRELSYRETKSENEEMTNDPLDEIIIKLDDLAKNVEDVLKAKKDSQVSSRKSSFNNKSLKPLDVTSNENGFTTGKIFQIDTNLILDILTDKIDEALETLREVQLDIKDSKRGLDELPGLRHNLTEISRAVKDPSSPSKGEILSEIRSEIKLELKSIFSKQSPSNSNSFLKSKDYSYRGPAGYSGIRTPRYSGDLGIDHSNMAEFIFRTSSVIVNFVAELIKESRFCASLKVELVNYIRLNIDRARRYFDLKSQFIGEDYSQFYNSGVEELKSLGIVLC